jgi:transposase
MARTHEKYTITEEQRQGLESLLRSPKTAQGLAFRAKIVLLTSAGKTAEEVAEQLSATLRTIYRWRKRFKEDGLEGLHDQPRSGQPKKLSVEQVKEVLRMTVECIPREATHWSVRLMAKAAKITTWQVRQIWNGADLKPHRLKSFKISNDPNFAEKVIDIVGLYLAPPDKAAVLSVDEKTQIQALDRTQPMLPMRPGQIERRTHDYKRNGTTNLYAAFDILTGKVIGRTTKRHRAKEFLDFLRQVDKATHLILHCMLSWTTAARIRRRK